MYPELGGGVALTHRNLEVATAALRAHASGTVPAPLDPPGIDDCNEIMVRKPLTRQYALLDALEGNRQLLVEGCAGSGKTWNAVDPERAAEFMRIVREARGG